MEVRLKTISKAGIDEANSKAELYRLLHEPEEAESICRDVLAVEASNQLALRLIGLAITDQFSGSPGDRFAEAEAFFQRLADPYERLYYSGLAYERWAKAQLRAGRPPHTLWVLFEKAMQCFAEAEKIRPTGNDDSILRWNSCARLIGSRPESEWLPEFERFESHDGSPL